MDSFSHPLTRLRATLNPYLFALKLIRDRLRWDLQPQSWRSRARLRALRDVHQGKKCVIACNGPSLLQSDLDLLQDSGVFTFGLNKIHLLFDRSRFRPSCIVAVNRLVLEQSAETYRSLAIPLFLDSYAARFLKGDHITFLHSTEQARFARDVSISLQQGYTVTFVALQLAFHMGFQEVALIGCDHSFAIKGPANATVIAGEKDESHFDPRYFSGGVRWDLPDLAGSEYYYDLAGRVFNAFGRRIVNATVGGKLEIFERLKLEDFLE